MVKVFFFWGVVGAALVAGQSQSSWIEEQYNASLRMLLANIYSNGTVIASPSRSNPDYYVCSLKLNLILVSRTLFEWCLL
jgi:hypothetical protein